MYPPLWNLSPHVHRLTLHIYDPCVISFCFPLCSFCLGSFVISHRWQHTLLNAYLLCHLIFDHWPLESFHLFYFQSHPMQNIFAWWTMTRPRMWFDIFFQPDRCGSCSCRQAKVKLQAAKLRHWRIKQATSTKLVWRGTEVPCMSDVMNFLKRHFPQPALEKGAVELHKQNTRKNKNNAIRDGEHTCFFCTLVSGSRSLALPRNFLCVRFVGDIFEAKRKKIYFGLHGAGCLTLSSSPALNTKADT